MALREILKYPSPVLKQRAAAVDNIGGDVARLVADMAETMYAAPGVGLAAPQVADPRRILVLDPGEKEERGKRFFAMVNPRITERSEDFIPWNETCLSVPEFEIELKRNRRVKVEWQAPEDGAHREGWFEDYEAVIVQHELDHLEGTVLLDHASRFKRGWYLRRVAKAKQRVTA